MRSHHCSNVHVSLFLPWYEGRNFVVLSLCDVAVFSTTQGKLSNYKTNSSPNIHMHVQAHQCVRTLTPTCTHAWSQTKGPAGHSVWSCISPSFSWLVITLHACYSCHSLVPSRHWCCLSYLGTEFRDILHHVALQADTFSQLELA